METETDDGTEEMERRRHSRFMRAAMTAKRLNSCCLAARAVLVRMIMIAWSTRRYSAGAAIAIANVLRLSIPCNGHALRPDEPLGGENSSRPPSLENSVSGTPTTPNYTGCGGRGVPVLVLILVLITSEYELLLFTAPKNRDSFRGG